MCGRGVRRLRNIRVPVLALTVALISHPALAQVSLEGMWRPMARNQDGSGMIGDSGGVPLSTAAQARAQSWSAEDFDVAEWVCRPHVFDYSLEGPLSQMHVWTEVDEATQKILAYHMHINQEEQETTIWMDGRSHPPQNTLHTWSGFSTGEWDGNVLVVTTTHLKEGYLRRSGIMRSDAAVLRTRWQRLGNYLQATSILYDRYQLTEPYIRSTMMWSYDPAFGLAPYPCEEATETAVPRGHTPNFLPGKSGLPDLNPKVTDRFGTPYEPRLGGAATMYPDYIATMKAMPRPGQAAGAGVAEGRGN